MTVVMWLLGCVLSRMWNLEWKRRQQAFELRERVHLHAYAMDILNNPSLQVQNLDPVIKRQLLRKLRMQTPVEYCKFNKLYLKKYIIGTLVYFVLYEIDKLV